MEQQYPLMNSFLRYKNTSSKQILFAFCWLLLRINLFEHFVSKYCLQHNFQPIIEPDLTPKSTRNTRITDSKPPKDVDTMKLLSTNFLSNLNRLNITLNGIFQTNLHSASLDYKLNQYFQVQRLKRMPSINEILICKTVLSNNNNHINYLDGISYLNEVLEHIKTFYSWIQKTITETFKNEEKKEEKEQEEVSDEIQKVDRDSILKEKILPTYKTVRQALVELNNKFESKKPKSQKGGENLSIESLEVLIGNKVSTLPHTTQDVTTKEEYFIRKQQEPHFQEVLHESSKKIDEPSPMSKHTEQLQEKLIQIQTRRHNELRSSAVVLQEWIPKHLLLVDKG